MENVQELNCGKVSLLIECVDTAWDQKTSGTVPSSLGDDIKKVSENVFSDLATAVQDISDRFINQLDAVNRPKEVSLELDLAITTSGKILIFSGETEAGIKLKMTWKN